MGAKEKKLKEFEKRLLEDKKWLHDLTYTTDSSDKMYKRKLEYYERELKFMEQQFDNLYMEATGVPVRRASVATDKPISNTEKVQHSEKSTEVNEGDNRFVNKDMLIGTHIAPDGSYVSAQTVAMREATKDKDVLTNQEEISKDEGVLIKQENVYEGVYSHDAIEQENKNVTSVSMKDILTSDISDLKNVIDFEKVIGKSFMGIAASVLIFAGIVYVASMVVPNFTNAIKMILMYAVSLGFLGVGLYKMYTKPEDKFFLTITGCGVGALYISLFLTNIYFKSISDIVLYVLIAIWSVGVCYLSKQKNVLFMIIGNLGITVAMITGAQMVSAKENDAMLLALVIFYIISAGMFNVAHYSRDFSKVGFNHIINGINMICLYEAIFEEKISVASVLILVIMFVYLGLIVFSKFENSMVVFPLSLATYLYVICGQLDFFMKEEVWGIIIYAISILLVWYIVSKEFEYEITRYVTIGIAIVYMVVGLCQSSVVADHGMAVLIVLPLLIYGFIKSDSMLKYSSIAVLFGQQYVKYIESSIGYYDNDKDVIVSSIGSATERLIVGLIVLGIAIVLIYKFKEQYSKIFKYTVHIGMFMLLFFVTMQLVNCIGELTVEDWWEHDFIATQIGFVIATIYNIVMLKTYGKDFDTGEPEGHRMYEFLNFLMMWIGIIAVGELSNPFLHILVIITLIMAFMVNSKKYLDIKDTMWPGIYVGAKFVVLLIVILNSFEAASYVISIACLVFAIISIVLGFKYNYKSLRVFGLILSMISVFKLLVIDISYEDEVGNAISFIISGILCFSISMIYNIIEKKVPKE